MSGRIPLLSLLFLVVLCGCTTFTSTRDDYDYQEVFYLTTREDTGQTNQLEDRYSENRGQPSFGVAMMAIDPRDSLSRFARPQANHVLEQSSLLRPHEMQQLVPLTEAGFLDGLKAYPSTADSPAEVLIFIHGYRRTVEQVLSNAAHLRHELNFPGPVIAFCWPSTNTVSGYLADIENLDWSQPELLRLIKLVSARFPRARIHLMAHSLGNRALIRSLAEVIRSGQGLDRLNLGEIIFMAPDYDRAIFMDKIAKLLGSLPSRKTLYVSAEDFPLMTSTRIFQYPRLGDSSEGIPVVNGVETVDVSDAITMMNGHGYYEADPATIEDLYYLVREDRGADQRPRLIRVETEQGPYWRLEKEVKQ